MIGLLFGELKRLSISHRVLLVIGAVAIALVTNFLRAIFLVWIAATRSISEVNRWHDLAGYTIVGLVFLGTFGLAYLLGKSQIRKPEIRNPKSGSAIRNSHSMPVRLGPIRNFRLLLFGSSLLDRRGRGGRPALVSRARAQSCCKHTVGSGVAGERTQFSAVEDRRRGAPPASFR